MKSFTLWQVAGIFLPFLLIISKSQSQVVTVNSGNWNTPATWSTGTLPGATDDVIIRHAVTVSNSAFSATIRSLTLENGTLNANATLSFNSGSAIRDLHILNDLTIIATTDNNCRLQLQGSGNTSTVDGNIILNRNHSGFVDAFGVSLRSGSSMTANNLSITYANSSDDNQEIFIRENSSLVLSGDINVLSTGGAEEPSIDVVDDALLECQHFNMELALPEAPSGVGRDAELRVWDNGRAVVHGNFIATRRGGRRINITIGNSAPAQASLLVEGNMVLEHFDGLNHTNKDFPVTVIDQSSLTVRGNLTAHSTAVRAMNLSFFGSSRFEVDGLVTLTGSSVNNLTINAFNTSSLFFGGDIVMNFPISPNPNIFFFSAASPNISTVTFDGSANQTVPGSETYGNLIIDNLLHVTLAGNITVNNQLNMVSGKMIAATRVITLPLGAAISGSSTAYICNGKLSRGLAAGAGPYWFYVGDTAKGYSPVTLSNLSATTTFEVTYFPVDAGAAAAPGPYPTGTKVPVLEKVSSLEYWMIDRATGTGAAQVALGWNVYSGVNGTALNQLRIAHWDGTRWTDTGPNVYSGDATAGMVRTTLDINSFSPFTLASTTPDNFVILSSSAFAGFTATPEHNKVLLRWAGAGSLAYQIERSEEGINFQTIGFVYAKENANRYSWHDEQPLSCKSYYRIRYINSNGRNNYSATATVNMISNEALRVFPNPVVGNNMTISLPGCSRQTIYLQVIDAGGRIIHAARVQSDSKKYTLPLQQPGLLKGIYLVQLRYSGGRAAMKVVVQ